MNLYGLKFLNIYRYLFFMALAVILFTACNRNTVFEENKTLPDKTWSQDNILKFNVTIKDTISKNNFFINLRNSGDYGFCNLFLFMRTIYPDGADSRDTIECILAKPDGEWLGKGRNIIDNHILFKKAVIFKKPGIYSFEFIHGMRVEYLKGIEDFGISIETTL